jgi:hypothetical protein
LTSDVRALLPETRQREPGSGEGLTALGVLLRASLPLLVAGLLLYGG